MTMNSPTTTRIGSESRTDVAGLQTCVTDAAPVREILRYPRPRMVVIFGWGAGEARDLGEVAPLVCPNCHNLVFLHQIHTQKKVSLYFVPIAQYGSNEYLSCPVCRAGLEIAPQQKVAVNTMRASTTIFRQGRMAPDEYQARVMASGLRSASRRPDCPRRRRRRRRGLGRRRRRPRWPTGSPTWASSTLKVS